ncbi:prepilin peptidase-dependent protein [Serratia sp. NPDC078593]|uniref:prepilin peptidase-dependent protein n=1 Tax=unclassified Serratia (in: enterobacteria) TaxID=2647522 RepID=UPI0037CD4D53
MLIEMQGFTLPEVLLAMSVGSMIALAAAKAYPVLRQQSVTLNHYYRLESTLRQLAFGIEKDIRRAGFCAGACKGKSLVIGHSKGEAHASCVISTYDLNRNGRWEETGSEAERFAYRLRQGALESQRGVSHCNGSGWERLLDHQEIQIDTFRLDLQPGRHHTRLVTLSLAGHSTLRPDITRALSWSIRVETP